MTLPKVVYSMYHLWKDLPIDGDDNKLITNRTRMPVMPKLFQKREKRYAFPDCYGHGLTNIRK
jgi:hypothetical protein